VSKPADGDNGLGLRCGCAFDVSEVRTGRKPGTKVFTVRAAPGGVPTLMLTPSPERELA